MEVHRERRLADTVGEGERGTSWENSTEAGTSPWVKQTAGGDLLCDSGSSAQCSVTPRGVGWGERFEREGTYVYLWQSC